MPAACCGMDGNVSERNHVHPRQQAGRTYSGSKLRAVHGENGRAEILWVGDPAFRPTFQVRPCAGGVPQATIAPP